MLNKIWAFMILGGILCGVLTGRLEEVTRAALDGAGEAVTLCITMTGVVALWMGLMEIAKEAGLVERMTKGIAPFLSFLFPRIPKGHPALEYIATNVIANILGLGWACTPAGLKAMEALAQLEAQRGNPEYLEEGKKRNEEVLGAEGVKDGFDGKRKMKTEEPVNNGEKTMFFRGEKGTKEKIRRKRILVGEKKTNGKKREGREQENGGRQASNEMCNFLILNISSLQLIPVNMIAYRSQYGSANPAAIVAPAILATLASTLVAILFCKCMDRGRK